MHNVFYSTTNGERDGRASHFFKNQARCQGVIDAQNEKAVDMDIKSRYQMATAVDTDVDPKNIR